MAMYTCYYDASGSQSQPDKPLVVVGLLSTEGKWLKCEKEWDAVLAEFGAPYLHMKEFAPGVGPFASWKDDKPRRADFLNRLIMVLKHHVNKVFQYRMVPDVFWTLNKERKLVEEWGGPYALLAAFSLLQAESWWEIRHGLQGHQLHQVVEKGDAGQGAFMNSASKWERPPTLLRKVDPATGRHLVPFQATDFLAYESRRNIEIGLSGQEQTIRASLAELLRQLPYERGYIDEEVMRRAFDGLLANIPKRLPNEISASTSAPTPSAPE